MSLARPSSWPESLNLQFNYAWIISITCQIGYKWALCKTVGFASHAKPPTAVFRTDLENGIPVQTDMIESQTVGTLGNF
jgi:hypothetical protein